MDLLEKEEVRAGVAAANTKGCQEQASKSLVYEARPGPTAAASDPRLAAV